MKICTCSKDTCNNEFDEETAQFTAFNLQKGYEEEFFCSKECLAEWVAGKKTAMWAMVVLGIICSIAFLVNYGEIWFGLFGLVLPYTIRQIGGTLINLLDGGDFSGALGILLLLLAAGTIVYPAYKFFQEFNEYKRLKKTYDL